MSKALIIKGADFSANKVTTISFGTVPCEGISFASDAITITDTNPVTVEYTLTPNNTTDPVIWASSDANVVTVSGGVLTIVGIGTATLTATCGNFTATASVTVAIAYIPNFSFTSISKASNKNFISCSTAMGRLSGCGSGVQKAQHNFVASSGGDVFPIIIPNGTKSVRVNIGSGAGTSFYNSADSAVWFASDTPCGDSNFPNAATYVAGPTTFNPRSETPFTTNVPEGANAVAFLFHLNSSAAEGTDPNTLAASLGITFEFLATTA